MAMKSMASSGNRHSGDLSSSRTHSHSHSNASTSSIHNEASSFTSHSNGGHSTPHSSQSPSKLIKSRLGGSSKKSSMKGAEKSVPVPIPTLDADVSARAGLPLDDDPFAKADVNVMRATTPSRNTETDGTTTDGGQDEYGPPEGSLSAPRTPKKIFAHPSRHSPPSPDEYKSHRTKRRGDKLEKAIPPTIVGVAPSHDRELYFPLESFLSTPALLECLLPYLSHYEWSLVWSVSRRMKNVMGQQAGLRECILERFLSTVGYARWSYEGIDPLELSLKDLNDYMRGVSMPTFQYYQISQASHPGRSMPDLAAREGLTDKIIIAAATTRAYTRVVLRLRAQAEAEHAQVSKWMQQNAPPSAMRSYSRPPSPTFSSAHGHSGASRPTTPHKSPSSQPQQLPPNGRLTFRSPLVKLRRAPLLRVFVPNPDSDWLSDTNVLECESELKKAGVAALLRPGDVIWDVAVGDEGNLGRMVWDGSYLIDLDYSYSTVGDLPKYLHTLSFSPSYFHRVLRTGANTNPILRVDVSPWGDQIAMNLQLLQDRVRTETPQGNIHNVVRWVHRSSFVLKPPTSRPHGSSVNGKQNSSSWKIQLPGAPSGTFVDSGWYGTIVVETEGTNEHLGELQERCGKGVFPPKLTPMGQPRLVKNPDALKVWRILREKSRPGEIWIRMVCENERIN